jgi:hypothetical protein
MMQIKLLLIVISHVKQSMQLEEVAYQLSSPCLSDPSSSASSSCCLLAAS